MEIRTFEPQDWPAVWAVLEPVFRAGETYGVDPAITESAARAMWVEQPLVTGVARGADGALLGTYYLKPNQGGPGAHVCNAGYVVAPEARGQGVAGALCRDSMARGRRHGFTAMQYNLVATTNRAAIGVWERHGFAVAGRLPGAFRHPHHGPVDALVMYRRLDDDTAAQ